MMITEESRLRSDLSYHADTWSAFWVQCLLRLKHLISLRHLMLQWQGGQGWQEWCLLHFADPGLPPGPCSGKRWNEAPASLINQLQESKSLCSRAKIPPKMLIFCSRRRQGKEKIPQKKGNLDMPDFDIWSYKIIFLGCSEANPQ